MARDHGRLRWRLWSDPEFLALPRDEQWLYMMFLGQPGLSFAGVLSLTPHRWAGLSAGTDDAAVQKALRGLVDGGWVLVAARSDEVLLRNHAEDDGLLDSPNMARALVKDFQQVTSPLLRAVIQIELHALAELPEDRRPGTAGCWDTWENKKGETQPPALAPLLSLRLPDGMEAGFTLGLGGRFRRELPGWLDSEWADPVPRPIVAGDVRQPFRHRTANPSAKPSTEPLPKGLPKPSTEGYLEGLGKPSTEPSDKPSLEPSVELSPEPSTQPSPEGLGEPFASRAHTPAPALAPSLALAPPSPATGTGQALARPDDVEGVIAEARWARPAWSERQIRWALERAAAAGRTLLEIRGALLTVAADTNTESPGRITHAGPWWQRTDLASLPPMPPWCRLCDLASSRQVRDEASGQIVPCPACHPTQNASREVVNA
jgi:hypothetical protein